MAIEQFYFNSIFAIIGVSIIIPAKDYQYLKQICLKCRQNGFLKNTNP